MAVVVAAALAGLGLGGGLRHARGGGGGCRSTAAGVRVRAQSGRGWGWHGGEAGEASACRTGLTRRECTPARPSCIVQASTLVAGSLVGARAMRGAAAHPAGPPRCPAGWHGTCNRGFPIPRTLLWGCHTAAPAPSATVLLPLPSRTRCPTPVVACTPASSPSAVAPGERAPARCLNADTRWAWRSPSGSRTTHARPAVTGRCGLRRGAPPPPQPQSLGPCSPLLPIPPGGWLDAILPSPACWLMLPPC